MSISSFPCLYPHSHVFQFLYPHSHVSLITITHLYIYTGLFSVSSDGRISTDKEIDKEMIDSDVTFVITATDNGGLTDTVSV